MTGGGAMIGSKTSTDGGRGAVVSVVCVAVFVGLALWSVIAFFPLAVIPGLAGAVSSIWARREFPHYRALFTALAVVCIAIVLASLVLDLTLLASGDRTPSTRVSPI